MSTRSFAEETTDRATVLEALRYHLHEIVTELAEQQAVATALRVLAYPSRFSDYALQGLSVEVTLSVPSSNIFLLEQLVSSVIQRHYLPGVPYKKAGIVVSVRAAEGLTETLFPSETEARTRGLTETILIINRRQGRGAIRLGAVAAKHQLWQSRQEALSPDYTTNWRCLRTVKA